MSTTFDVCQLLRSLLKLVAPPNASCMFVTLLTSHLLRSPAKFSAL